MITKQSSIKCVDFYSKYGGNKLRNRQQISDYRFKFTFTIYCGSQYNLQHNTMKSHLFFIVILFCSQGVYACENNGTYSQQTKMCTCTEGFLGPNCTVVAYKLKDTFTKIPVGQNFTYAYFNPDQKVIYKFVLTFCSESRNEEVNLTVFAQEEEKNGQFNLVPKRTRDNVDLLVGTQQNCKQIYSSVLVSMEKKNNNEVPKIIFGFKLTNSEKQLKDQFIFVSCETSPFFTVNLLVTILVSFFVIITFFMFASVIFMLRKKWLQRRIQREQEQKKIKCVNSIMPSKKYSTLVEQSIQVNEFDLVCSICLCQFIPEQNVRKTPCGHLFHSQCLDSWCNSHLNCPICRKNFEEEQQMQAIQKSLQPDNSNIREPIL